MPLARPLHTPQQTSSWACQPTTPQALHCSTSAVYIRYTNTPQALGTAKQAYMRSPLARHTTPLHTHLHCTQPHRITPLARPLHTQQQTSGVPSSACLHSPHPPTRKYCPAVHATPTPIHCNTNAVQCNAIHYNANTAPLYTRPMHSPRPHQCNATPLCTHRSQRAALHQARARFLRILGRDCHGEPCGALHGRWVGGALGLSSDAAPVCVCVCLSVCLSVCLHLQARTRTHRSGSVCVCVGGGGDVLHASWAMMGDGGEKLPRTVCVCGMH